MKNAIFNFLFLQTPQNLSNTQGVSRTSSISISENTSREQKPEEGELSTSASKNFRLLRVPSVSNQDISINNNDVSYKMLIIFDIIESNDFVTNKNSL